MTVNELIIELQKLQHKGKGNAKVAVWDEDIGVAKHITYIEDPYEKEEPIVVNVSVIPV